MTQEPEQAIVYDSSSSSTNVEQSDYHEEITKLRTELIALKSFVVEQLNFIKQSVHEPFKVEKKSQQENYISRLLKLENEAINYLKQENKTKSSTIQSLIYSGSTNNYDNDNSYSKSSNNDENNNSGIENDDINIYIPNDDSNINMRRRKNKNKLSKDKGKYIKNKHKNSNKINSKNDNNKNNTKNKYNKSSEFNRSGLNDTISNTSTYNQKEKVFILGDSMVKNVYGFLLTRNLNYKCLIKIRSFPGA